MATRKPKPGLNPELKKDLKKLGKAADDVLLKTDAALALSRRVQADGIDKATDEEEIARIMIHNAAAYIDLLKVFDLRADAPAGVSLRQA